MSSSVELYETITGTTIWKLDSEDGDLVIGIADTIFYGLVNYPYEYTVKRVHDEVVGFDGSYRERVTTYQRGGYDPEDIDEMIAYRHGHKLTPDGFVIVLKPLGNNDEYYIRIADNVQSYLQGVLSIAKQYNIDIDDILARKPYKDGIYYDITQ